MTANEFLIRYKGCEVVVQGMPPSHQDINGTYGRVSSIDYSGDYVFIVGTKPNGKMGYYHCLPKYLYLITPLIFNTYDDCDDCGAVGKEKCKESCPNKENI